MLGVHGVERARRSGAPTRRTCASSRCSASPTVSDAPISAIVFGCRNVSRSTSRSASASTTSTSTGDRSWASSSPRVRRAERLQEDDDGSQAIDGDVRTLGQPVSSARAMRTIAVVGTSLAGLRAAEDAAPARATTAGIVAIGAEPHLPYDRPPLSKELLAGECGARPTSCCASRASTTSTSTGGSARARDRARRRRARGRRSHDGDARRVRRPRASRPARRRGRCPNQPDLDGVFMLRTLDDALALRGAARRGARRSS